MERIIKIADKAVALKTTEGLMVHAISRGLMLSDFHELSVGMILDYISC